MGNNPSKGPAGDAPSGHVPNASGDRKVVRRTSLHAIPTHKATVADPSASRETAAGHSAAYQGSVQQRLQSRNTADSSARAPGRPERRVGPITEYDHDAPTPDLSNPMQVPVSRHAAGRDSMAPSGPPPNSYYNASTHLHHPPRLPLPIGDATATPGSPIMGPEDSHIQSMPADRLLDEHMNPEASNISTETMDSEELDELQPFTTSGVGKAVPAVIEWTAPGQKVYVTGTFVNWEKKFRLQRGSDHDGAVMSTTLNLRPGTHHLKFIVDGEMRASDTLPTAVDFTNHLVNYMEISADDARKGQDKSSTSAGAHPPQAFPDSSKDGKSEETADDPRRRKRLKKSVIPQFLADLDKEEDSPAYLQAANVIGDTPTPPSLPLFLGKSILNSTTPTKDDSSVLNYPNHTVLNHLATSSIKNGVLATSVTTRYKRKYVTTILYKPTGDITE
ncbi:Immunoglobulin E-set [Penicillium argentinense]|uniref:Immunoglobulin E-set n=1 Tax=Penicillium argentinense TaxID=1131581 RepID=A0A9W9G0E7_9EURO|nr:Immunoglobulin E-set [Penicillium argentinense]KAJ5109810.1 Immunoglobulin E-set [Penicillium argentinense]